MVQLTKNEHPMLIIFGTRGRITNASDGDILPSACPNCEADLRLKDLKTWFTLFFIPVFPFDKIDSFYQCSSCDSSYKQSARDALMNASISKDEMVQQAEKLFAKTLVSCMMHMANIDGDIDASEMAEINTVKDRFSQHEEELQNCIDTVKNSDDPEEFVYDLLRQSREALTAEAIMGIIGQSAKVLLADGKIDKEEEKLLKEYLLVCGLPKSLYETVLEKMNDKKPHLN